MAGSLLNRVRFGWTSHGGANRQLVKEDLPEWACQACSDIHPKEIPCFMFELYLEEYVKICPKCQRTRVSENITSFDILVKRVRS